MQPRANIFARAGISSAFIIVTTLFFAWGFITSNNDPLIAALKASFSLSYTEALFTQLVSFAAYGVMSFPAAVLLARIGSTRAIICALVTMVAGCLLVQTVVSYQSYGIILAALFVLGLGITTLQVAANPLAAALGPPDTSHFRLTFAQAFNSLGVVLGSSIGSQIMLRGDVLRSDHGPITNAADRMMALNAVSHAFMLIAALLIVMIIFIWFSRKAIERASALIGAEQDGRMLDALKSRWAVFGAVAIGLYVGAEVSIGSIMINFLNQKNVLGLPLAVAGQYLSYGYWGGALIGRFLGSYLLTRVPATRLLTGAAVMASTLCLTVALTDGAIAGYAALAVGFFNSIMFPTIFTITLERSGVSQSATSGLLCVAILGGAIIPYVFGELADRSSLSVAFFLPMLAYAVIALFAFAARSINIRKAETASGQLH